MLMFIQTSDRLALSKRNYITAVKMKNINEALKVQALATELAKSDEALSEIVDAVERTFNPDAVKFAVMGNMQLLANLDVISFAMSHPDIEEKISALIYDCAVMVLATEAAMSDQHGK